MKDLKNYVAGEWLSSEQTFVKTSPWNGEQVATVHEATADMVDQAVKAGQQAVAGPWGSSPKQQRMAMLNAIANAITARADEFAEAESKDTGRPLPTVKGKEDAQAANIFRMFAAELGTYTNTSNSFMTPMGEQALYYTNRRPKGVVACIAPWNMPLILMCMKVAPALAMGNAVICKPSEDTPSSCALLAEVMDSVGLPKGVFNLIHGHGRDAAGDFITSHPGVAAISFTGAVPTGSAIMTAAAKRIANVNLELGGKNPAIVFADANMEKALMTLTRAVTYNCGQICFSAERIYVEASIFDSFVEQLAERMAKVPVGDAEAQGLGMGPLITPVHRDKVVGYINKAKELGATVHLGGGIPQFGDERDQGNFVEPTILSGLAEDSVPVKEEIFGPVVHITPFTEEADAVAMANDTDMGLAASIWTQDISRAHRIAGQMQAGNIWVNTWQMRDPRSGFQGAGLSGLGQQGGVESLEFMSEPSTVSVVL